MYDNKDVFDKSWNKNYLSEELIQHNGQNLSNLKRSLQNCIKRKRLYYILDIGIGNARISYGIGNVRSGGFL
jgi:hypothetical protein